MKLTRLLSISLLSISTLLTGCKPANSEDTPGDGVRIDFPKAKIRVVIKSHDEGTKYVTLRNNNDVSAASINATFLKVSDELYTEAILDNQTYQYKSVEVDNTKTPFIQENGYYKFAFSYSNLKLRVKTVSQS